MLSSVFYYKNEHYGVKILEKGDGCIKMIFKKWEQMSWKKSDRNLVSYIETYEMQRGWIQ